MHPQISNELLRHLHSQLNTLRPRQNGRHFADDIFKCIFLYENAQISLKISLKFVPKVRINNIPALVQIMAWRRPGDTPLSEPMLVSLLTHICFTRPQWVNTWLLWIGQRRDKKYLSFGIWWILYWRFHDTYQGTSNGCWITCPTIIWSLLHLHIDYPSILKLFQGIGFTESWSTIMK